MAKSPEPKKGMDEEELHLYLVYPRKSITTVIPRFTRLLWQPKNRVNRNSRYTSHSIDKKCLKKCQKNFY